MILSGPLCIRQISEKEWHLRIELDTSDMKLRKLEKLFRWPGHDVIHCSITFGGEFHDLSESKKSFFVQATQKFPFVSMLVASAETGGKYSYNSQSHLKVSWACYRFNLSGIIITGGYDTRTSIEVLDPDVSPSSCSLPQLPEGRFGHTLTGLTACGGYGSAATRRSCVTLSESSWIKSHNLVHRRQDHCAWETDSGIILLGGSLNNKTTELLKEDGGSEEHFPLKYPIL